jgi:hypothetical protein
MHNPVQAFGRPNGGRRAIAEILGDLLAAPAQ